MLATAQELCRNVLPWIGGYDHIQFGPAAGSPSLDISALITSNGDAEMWQNLCSIDNPPPVRGLVAESWTTDSVNLYVWPLKSLYRQEGYPANTPVGDQYGHVASNLSSDNTMPWCIVAPTNSADLAAAQKYVVDHSIGGVALPFCPQSLVSGGYLMQQDLPGSGGTNTDLENWATRGAINAGLAVFLYLDQVVVHGLKPKPAFDHCEQISN
jgi:hypothetical protein